MAEFRIVVRVDPTGARTGTRQVERELNRVGQTADRTRQLIARAFAFAGIGLGVRELIGLADTFTNIQNRLRTVTTGTEQLTVVTGELFDIANRTRSSFEATAEVYARVGLAAKDLGISQQQTLQFTESLNQAVALSGASATEAQAGLIQLSQGLASGALRGDELRSVLEQLPVVADVIADSLGVTRGQLRELGAEGAITADIVLNAFAEAREELEDRFAKTVPTIGQSLTVLRNNVVGLVGAFSQSSGAAEGLSKAILFLAENVETIARVVAAFAIVLGVQFAVRAIGAAVAGLRTLTLALLANPFTAIATAITVVISLLITFGDQLQLTAGSSATVFDFLFVLFQRLLEVASTVINFVIGLFGDFQGSLDDFDFLDFVNAGATAIDALIGVFTGGFRATLAVFDDFPRLLGDIFVSAFNFILNGTEEFVNQIIGALNRIPGVSIDTLDGVIPRLENPFEGAARGVGQAALDGFQEGFDRSLARNLVADIAADAEGRASDRAAREAQQAADLAAARANLATPSGPARTSSSDADPGAADRNAILAREIALLEQEADVLGVVGVERQKLQAVLEIEETIRSQLRQANKDLSEEELTQLSTLTESERERIGQLVERNAVLERQGDVLEKIRGPVEEYRLQVAALNELLAEGAITQAQFNAELANTGVQAALLDLDQQLFGPFGDGLRAQTELLRAQQAEQLLIVQQALEARIISEEEAAERIMQINRQMAAATQAAQLASFSTVFQQAEHTFSGIAQVARDSAGEQSDAYKALFAVTQAFALANAIVSTASGVTQALGSAPPPINFVLAGLVAAAGAAQIATIVGQTLALRDGGFVAGPGTSRSDSVPAMLSNGEFVVNARATRQNRALLEAMNSGQQVSGGGGVTVVQNITTPDADSFRRSEGQRNARLQETLARTQRRQTNG